MKELKDILHMLVGESLYQIVVSSPIHKNGSFKVKIRPVMIQGGLMFQENRFEGTKVFHHNYTKTEMIDYITDVLLKEFRQLQLDAADEKLTVLASKKGKLTIKRSKNKEKGDMPDLSHNRLKAYILEADRMVPFLVDLGVQTKDGRTVQSKYDKFRQINRYLEFVQDILPILPKDRTIQIIDFGCGKSYLTFALYYYLHELKGLDVQVTGLDLKEDVIEKCNQLKEKYGYGGLRFILGDISTYQGAEQVDMVVTLHACDTATDYALQKAVLWDARVIFSVPCCQHEINGQIQNELLAPVLKYGLLKERISALLTDGIRAGLLEQMGYDTQILEFIDMEHTPKNILIRAVKQEGKKCADSELQKLMEELHIRPALKELLTEKQ